MLSTALELQAFVKALSKLLVAAPMQFGIAEVTACAGMEMTQNLTDLTYQFSGIVWCLHTSLARRVQGKLYVGSSTECIPM